MARRSLEQRNIRKLYRDSTGTMRVTLPIELVRELKWKDRQKVVVKKSGKKLIIEDWPARLSGQGSGKK